MLTRARSTAGEFLLKFRSLYLLGWGRTATVDVNGTTANFYKETKRERNHLLGLFYGNRHEQPVLKDLLVNLRNDETVWDIGANIGVYTCFIQKEAPSTTVHSFEPAPANADRISDNLDLNESTAEVHELALSDTDCQKYLSSQTMQSGDPSGKIVDDKTGIPIQLRRGESLVESEVASAPDVVKIDVEGAEVPVLDGMKDLLKKVRLLYCEVHDENDITRVNSILERSNFDVSLLYEREGQSFLRGMKP